MMSRRSDVRCWRATDRVVPWNIDRVTGVLDYEVSVEVTRGDGTISEFDLLGRIFSDQWKLVKGALDWLESNGQIERDNGVVRATERMRELLGNGQDAE